MKSPRPTSSCTESRGLVPDVLKISPKWVTHRLESGVELTFRPNKPQYQHIRSQMPKLLMAEYTSHDTQGVRIHRDTDEVSV